MGSRLSSAPGQLLLWCLLATSILIAGATFQPVSNCPNPGRKACALQRAKRGTKLTCCTKNAARPHAYPASGCVDLLRDRGYCGSCTNFCGKGQKCVAGKCVRPPPPPPPGTVPEDPSCAAILCPSPSICCAGTCCSINSTCCSGACTDLQTDSANCGLCGRKCQYPPGMVGIPRFCSEGVCVNG